MGCYLSDVREYAILVELYKVNGAEILWQTKDKQFLDVLVEETLELRKTPDERKKEKQQEISNKINKLFEEKKEVQAIDPTTGEVKTFDLTQFIQGVNK